MTTFQILKAHFSAICGQIRRSFGRKKCDHTRATQTILDTYPQNEWREAYNGEQLTRSVTYKLRCSGCGAVHIRSNQWEFQDI